jgi:hypothetical protein
MAKPSRRDPGRQPVQSIAAEAARSAPETALSGARSSFSTPVSAKRLTGRHGETVPPRCFVYGRMKARSSGSGSATGVSKNRPAVPPPSGSMVAAPSLAKNVAICCCASNAYKAPAPPTFVRNVCAQTCDLRRIGGGVLIRRKELADGGGCERASRQDERQRERCERGTEDYGHRSLPFLPAGGGGLDDRRYRAVEPLVNRGYSHSIVAGGFDVTSSTTRFTPGISLTIRLEMISIRSYGRRAQSAVIASSEVTARITTG